MIVILLNILIAQMSTTYTQAKKVARLEYDVDRISLLTRMERFPFLVSKWQRMEIEFWNIFKPGRLFTFLLSCFLSARVRTSV